MNSDTQRIEYTAMQEDCKRLRQQKYSDEAFLKEIKDDLKKLNEKIDDLMLVIEDTVKDTPTL